MSSFQFKKFTIQQNNTAMKVGTDSVLLGAWSNLIEGNILDIGSGTGLISLMIAQRTQYSRIDAVEIEKNAYWQLLDNINNSPWRDRIAAHHGSIQDFHPSSKYDLIISNPPFFINSTKASKSDRNTARHNDHLSIEELIKVVIHLLKVKGIFAVILPIPEARQLMGFAKSKNLYLNRMCWVKPNPNKDSKRVLMEFSFEEQEAIEEELTIETETRHHYTKEYISLTQDFYLKL